MVLVMLLAWVILSRVYEKSLLNILETFFITNLAIYVAAIAYIDSVSEKNVHHNTISCCMVGSAFVVFLLTVVYHSYKILAKTKIAKIMFNFVSKVTNSQADSESSVEIPVQLQEPTVSYVELNELREPLID